MASPWLLADQQRRRAAQAEELVRLTQPSGLAGQSFGYAQQNNPIPNEQSIYDKFVQENQVTPPARAVPDPPNVQAARKAVASYGVPWKEAAETGAHAMQQVFEPVSGAVMGVQGKIEGNQQKIDAAKKSLFMGGEGPNASDLAMQRTAGAVDLDPNEPAASRAATTAIKTPWEALPLVIGPGEVLSGGKMLAKPTNAMARKVHQAILSRAKEAGRGETLYSLGGVDAARFKEIKEQITKLPVGSNEYKNLKAEQKALSRKSMADDIERSSMERAAQRTEELGAEQIVADMKIGGEEGNASLTRPTKKSRTSGKWRDVLEGMPETEADEAMAHNAKVAMLRGEEYVNDLKTKGKLHHEKYTWLNDKFEQIKNYFEGGLDNPIVNDVARHVDELARLKSKRGIKGITADVLETKRTAFDPDAPLSPEQEAIIEGLGRHLEAKQPEPPPIIEGSADLTPAPLPRRTIDAQQLSVEEKPSLKAPEPLPPDNLPEQLSVLRPETKAQVQAAAEQAGNPEYGEKLVARAEELAAPPGTVPGTPPATPHGGPAQQQALPTMAEATPQTAAPNRVPAPAPPKTPRSQQPLGQGRGSAHYGPTWRLFPTIEERLIPWMRKARDKVVSWVDAATGAPRSAKFKHIAAETQDMYREAQEKFVNRRAIARSKAEPAFAEGRADPEVVNRLAKKTPGFTSETANTRFYDIANGRMNAADAAEQKIVDAYDNVGVKWLGKEAEDIGSAQMNKQGMLEPFKSGRLEGTIHHFSDEFLHDLSQNVLSADSRKAIQDIVDYNKALGYDITWEAAAEHLKSMAQNMVRGTPFEHSRLIPEMPVFTKKSDGSWYKVLKDNILPRHTGDLETSIMDSVIDGQAKDISFREIFGQHFDNPQAVKDFKANFPNHPVPVSRLMELKEAFGNTGGVGGRVDYLDKLNARFFGKESYGNNKTVGWFSSGSDKVTQNAFERGAGATGAALVKIPLASLGPKQLTQTFREVASTGRIRDFWAGLASAFKESGALDAGRKLEQSLTHASDPTHGTSGGVRRWSDWALSKLTGKPQQWNENIATAAGRNYMESLAGRKLGVTETRRLKEELKLSDNFIDRLKTVKQGTDEWDELSRVMADAMSRSTQFTGTPTVHTGRMAATKPFHQIMPYVWNYRTGTARRTLDLGREFVDVFSKEGLTTLERMKLLGDFVTRAGIRGIGTGVDMAWLYAFGMASNYAYSQFREGSLGKQGPRDKGWLEGSADFLGKTGMLGPMFDIANSAIQKHSVGEAVGHAMYPVSVVEKLGIRNPLVSNSTFGAWVIDDLASVFPGRDARNVIATAVGLAAAAYQALTPEQQSLPDNPIRKTPQPEAPKQEAKPVRTEDFLPKVEANPWRDQPLPKNPWREEAASAKNPWREEEPVGAKNPWRD